ncbi:MAG: hypothetical protein JW847_05790 [Candidatus Omnitrophica bacterium]|nr:hypothetical protein [Candidatus Omnitrophota bacterium]
MEKEEPAIPEHADSPPSGTASLETVPAEETAKEEMGLSGAHLSSQSAELQEKYEKLDALFKEKSADLEKTKASLDNEVKNRKDFNKVKDLLEKEIKDLRDRSHHVQLESENAKSEMEKHKKRVSQLEEKIAQLEKSLLEKERKIHDLAKQPQPPESPVKEKMDPDSPGASPSAEAASSLPEYQNKMEEATPQVSIPADIENNENQDDRFLQMSGPLGADPPGPYEEPFQDDQPMEEESFLKLQPDILSEETAKESPLADEIEQSIQSAPEPKIKPDPGSKHFPPGSTQGSGSPPKNHGQDTETNKNAKE